MRPAVSLMSISQPGEPEIHRGNDFSLNSDEFIKNKVVTFKLRNNAKNALPKTSTRPTLTACARHTQCPLVLLPVTRSLVSPAQAGVMPVSTGRSRRNWFPISLKVKGFPSSDASRRAANTSSSSLSLSLAIYKMCVGLTASDKIVFQAQRGEASID